MYIPSFNPLFSDRFPRYRCHYLLSSPLPVYLFPFFSFLFFSSFISLLSLSLSSQFSPAHFPSELRARRRHEHACVNRPILLQLCIPIYNCCFPTYEGDSGLARDSRGFLHVPILLLLHRRTADPSSLVSGQIPSSL